MIENECKTPLGCLNFIIVKSCTYVMSTLIASDIRNHDTKYFLVKKELNVSTFIFRRFECHHTHYQGAAFRLEFQFLLIKKIFIKL